MQYDIRETKPFKRDVKRLLKKYPKLKDIIKDLFLEIEKGKTPGLPLTTLSSGDQIFKLKQANPDARKGAAGGFRIIYYLITDDSIVYPLAIYSKSDKENLTDKQILDIVKELGL